MNPSQPPVESTFRLLIEVTAAAATADEASIEIFGKRWKLAWFDNMEAAPPFTCVSYSWGTRLAKNPFSVSGKEVSDRAVPVLNAAIKASQSTECWSEALAGIWRDEQVHAAKLTLAVDASQALWIDSFCLPDEPTELETCVLSMGAIYSKATQVLAVLVPGCSSTFRKIRSNMRIDHEDLLAVECDDWIERAWTYQEIARSKSVYFVAEGDGTVLLNHQELLDALVTGTSNFADNDAGSGRNMLVVQFPRLDSLQDVFNEFQTADMVGRPAFQVLCAMQKRLARDEADRIYAMLGVVADAPSEVVPRMRMQLAEYFMSICEEREDFSFLFSIGPRSTAPGRSWRPATKKFHPIVSGITAFGFGLSGSLKKTHLEMHKMCRMNGNVNNPVVSAISAFLAPSLPAQILEHLRKRGFTGSGDCLKLEYGYFFPQLPLPAAKELKGLFVAVSHGVQFAQGGPGILLRPDSADMNQFCGIGVFIGRSPSESGTINVC